ncbi:MAG: ChaN family lipoprotein [Candidatus Thiothrix putei]|uniref:ChaN family lipoprotein n=1 Tax=Candidatus Thiothrix putei TaxID=3080811 RepID=A0AA95HBD9_9GAMM|nr:MAG: ChaN family lipoprotein [Candidatus Thiothrix putei]
MFHNRHTLFPDLMRRTLLAACVVVIGVLPISSIAATVEHATLDEALAHIGEHAPTGVMQGKALPFSTLMDGLAQNRVVFVGEIHDRYDHHLHQLAVLQGLHQRNPKLAIGVEWFQQSFQPVLNDYLAGKLTEVEFLRRSEYFERWGYDYRQLRPILAYAKANGLPVLALNAPVELTRKVSEGGLEALSKAERAQLPPTIHPADADYQARLRKVFEAHSQDPQQFERFMLVQRIWDETMAYNAAKYLNANPEHQLVVLAGVGHISDGVGIPADLARQLPGSKVATVASSDSQDAAPAVDYTLLTAAVDLPPTGKLGVLLDTQGKGLSISALDKNSAAAKAGLQKGDRLATLEGVALKNMSDLKLALSQHQVGNAVKMTVERAGSTDLLAYTVVLQ